MNGTNTCYQEYLQGPCPKGRQFILPENSKELEPICMPTECDKNETRFMDICFPVPICKDEEFVRFIWNTNKTECDTLNSDGLGVFFDLRQPDLIGGIRSCPKGYSKDARGNCQKKLEKRDKTKKKRTTVNYGRGRNIRGVCCPGR